GDGHTWSVSENWETRTGLLHDVFSVTAVSEYNQLRERLKDKATFVEVLDAVYERDHGKSLREKKRARHWASGYMVADGRLWRIGDAKSIHARDRVECVSKKEAQELAWCGSATCLARRLRMHVENGHFGQDLIKIKLMDSVYSPKLDQSIVTAIL
ncbi:hypothetical protein B0H10DRAFT_1689492, partial [Mycena sp. CBHHK59/15]